MSVLSSSVYGFGPKSYGAGRMNSGLPVRNRIGANEPMCSQKVGLPGPPL